MDRVAYACKFCRRVFMERQLLIDHKRQQHYDDLAREHCEKLIAEGKTVPVEFQKYMIQDPVEENTGSESEAEDDEQESQSRSEGSDPGEDEVQDEEDQPESSAEAQDENDAEGSDGASESSETAAGEHAGRPSLRRAGLAGRLSEDSRRSLDCRLRPRPRRQIPGCADLENSESDVDRKTKKKRILRTPSKRPNYNVPDESDLSDDSDEPLAKKLERRASRVRDGREKGKNDSDHKKKGTHQMKVSKKLVTTEEANNSTMRRRDKIDDGSRERNGADSSDSNNEASEQGSSAIRKQRHKTDATCYSNGHSEKSKPRSITTTEVAIQTQLASKARSVQTEVDTRSVSTKTCSYVANWNQDSGIQVNPNCTEQGTQISRDTSEAETITDLTEIRNSLKDSSTETDRTQVADAATDPVVFETSLNAVNIACGSGQAMSMLVDAGCDATEAPTYNSIGCGTEWTPGTEVACGKNRPLTYMVDAQCDAAEKPSVSSVACGSDVAQKWNRQFVDMGTSPHPSVVLNELETQTDAIDDPCKQPEDTVLATDQEVEPESSTHSSRSLFLNHFSNRKEHGQTGTARESITSSTVAGSEQDVKPFLMNSQSFIEPLDSLPPIPSYLTGSRRISIGKDEYECWICDAPHLKTTYDLDQHLKQVHLLYSLKIFGCKKCKSSFSNPDSLKRHLEKAHMLVGLDVQEGMKHFKVSCEACNKRLNYKRFVEHIRRVHLSEAVVATPQPKFEYSCDTCSEVFTGSEALQEHKLTHSRSRTRLVCSKCTKTFTCLEGLHSHYEVDHHVPKRRIKRLNGASPSSAATSAEDGDHTSALASDISSSRSKIQQDDPNSSSHIKCHMVKQEAEADGPSALLTFPTIATRSSPRRISVPAKASATPSLNNSASGKYPRAYRRQLSFRTSDTSDLTPSTPPIDVTNVTSTIKSEKVTLPVTTAVSSTRTPKRKLSNLSSSVGSAASKKRKLHCGFRCSNRLARVQKSLRRNSPAKVQGK